MISKVIQSCLADRTVLTIAHRVDTVLGCDRFYIGPLLLCLMVFFRVLVMEDGCIVESGHPNILLQDSETRCGVKFSILIDRHKIVDFQVQQICNQQMMHSSNVLNMIFCLPRHNLCYVIIINTIFLKSQNCDKTRSKENMRSLKGNCH